MRAPTRPMVFVPPSGQLGIPQLASLAAEFDALSDQAGGQRYRASEFVRWLEAEAEYRRSLAEARPAGRTLART